MIIGHGCAGPAGLQRRLGPGRPADDPGPEGPGPEPGGGPIAVGQLSIVESLGQGHAGAVSRSSPARLRVYPPFSRGAPDLARRRLFAALPRLEPVPARPPAGPCRRHRAVRIAQRPSKQDCGISRCSPAVWAKAPSLPDSWAKAQSVRGRRHRPRYCIATASCPRPHGGTADAVRPAASGRLTNTGNRRETGQTPRPAAGVRLLRFALGQVPRCAPSPSRPAATPLLNRRRTIPLLLPA